MLERVMHNRFFRGTALFVRRYFDHRVARDSAALTYYLLFAMFPLLIFLSNLVGFFAVDIEGFLRQLGTIIPAEVLDLLIQYLRYVSRVSSRTLMTFSLIFSIWFPMRAANALLLSVRKAYGMGRPTQFLRHQAKVFLYTICLILTILLSLVLYLIIGLCYDSKPVDISQYLTGLSHGFNISLLTMLVPAFTGWLIYRKTPSLITLLLSALSACICALILQPEVLVKIAGEDCITAKSLFEGIMITCYTHTQVDCGMENINELVATRGMAGMLNTIWLILCAMCFGSCMVASGMLHAITHVLLKSIHSTISLVCSTVTSGVLLNLVMGDQFLSIIMNASIYKDEYAERGYRPELLSRSTEDSATVTSVLVPWTACGMTQSTVLGIPTLVYLPFCFFNIISPLMSCLVAILGFVPKPQSKEDKAPAVEEFDIH